MIFELQAKDIIDLDKKLNGELSVNKEELIALINSWGRNNWFYSIDQFNNKIKILKCEAKECFDLSRLDVSKITDMHDIFAYSNFNGNINSWNTSGVTNMSYMFSNTNFNQPLDKWNTSNVTFMNLMFYRAKRFNNIHSSNGVGLHNQDINSWNISNVTNMNHMFFYAFNFNSPLDKWNISNIKDMSSMFRGAKSFNQDISSWDVSNIQFCIDMFYSAKAFLDKYNNGKDLPVFTSKFKDWFIKNIMKLIEIVF